VCPHHHLRDPGLSLYALSRESAPRERRAHMSRLSLVIRMSVKTNISYHRVLCASQSKHKSTRETHARNSRSVRDRQTYWGAICLRPFDPPPLRGIPSPRTLRASARRARLSKGWPRVRTHPRGPRRAYSASSSVIIGALVTWSANLHSSPYSHTYSGSLLDAQMYWYANSSGCPKGHPRCLHLKPR
jgi:hypothetical protein